LISEKKEVAAALPPHTVLRLLVIDPFTASFVLAFLAPAFVFLTGALTCNFEGVGVNPEFHEDVSASALFAFYYHDCLNLVVGH
jgi:hypothetical protein